MKLSESIKPISYVKANAAAIITEVTENRKTIIVTQNGEAKVVILDIHEYERIQESNAFMKLIAMGVEDIRKGRYKPLREAFKDLDKRIRALKKQQQ